MAVRRRLGVDLGHNAKGKFGYAQTTNQSAGTERSGRKYTHKTHQRETIAWHLYDEQEQADNISKLTPEQIGHCLWTSYRNS